VVEGKGRGGALLVERCRSSEHSLGGVPTAPCGRHATHLVVGGYSPPLGGEGDGGVGGLGEGNGGKKLVISTSQMS